MSSQVITITFEGTLNAAPTHLDSIRVMNLTAGGDTTIYFPDNVLVLGTMGISEVSTPGPSMQALPNPIVGSTEVVLRSVRGAALITSHDVAGRELVARSANLNAGIQRIRVSCERPGVHLLTVVQGGVQSALRLTAMEGAGPASFELSIGGRRCTFVLEVLPLEYPFDPGIAYGSDVDQEANTFLTVTMAGQEWMAENLRVSSYANGDPIPNTTSSFSTGGWSYYNNDPQYEGPYGRLYNWYAVNDPRNICPSGWHVASDDDWNVLVGSLDPGFDPDALAEQSATAGGALKATGTNYWLAPNTGATNTSGFSALPGGIFLGLFAGVGTNCFWWTSTQSSASQAIFRRVDSDDASITRDVTPKDYLMSVRCVRD